MKYGKEYHDNQYLKFPMNVHWFDKITKMTNKFLYSSKNETAQKERIYDDKVYNNFYNNIIPPENNWNSIDIARRMDLHYRKRTQKLCMDTVSVKLIYHILIIKLQFVFLVSETSIFGKRFKMHLATSQSSIFTAGTI